MPTKHPRVSVTKDPELADALRRVRGTLEAGAEIGEAELIRRLALTGAESVAGDEAERGRALHELADPDLGGLDLDALASVEELDLTDLADANR